MIKCIRCQSTDGLVPYSFKTLTHAKTKYRLFLPNKYIYTYETIEAPVCKICIRDFDALEDKKSKHKKIFHGIGLLYLLGLIIFIGMLVLLRRDISIPMWVIVLLIVPELIVATYIIVMKRRFSAMKENPWRYFKNKGKGKVYVRPEGSIEWIHYNDWIAASIVESVEENGYCSACKSKIGKHDVYCNTCGERLN